jgi:glucose uptake protein
MLILLYAGVTVLSWGAWIGLADTVATTSQVKTFYVTCGNLVFATVILLWHSDPARWLWLPFLGGLLWALGNVCAFLGTRGIGLARAAGVWTSLNIAMGLAWGALLFDEFAGIGARAVVLWLALALVLAGLLLVVFARGGRSAVTWTGAAISLAGACGAGVLWGSYFIPVQLAEASLWVANLSLAAGMFVGGAAIAVGSGSSLTLGAPRNYVTLLAAGALWGTGNIGMLVLVETIGTGKGFTIAQLGLVVNALIGVLAFRNPPPRSRAAAVTFAGIALATTGGVLLGQLK